MKKIYVLFTILLVGLFVGCKSTQVGTESEYDRLCRIVPSDMADFIVKNCHGDYEVVNMTGGSPIIMTSKFNPFGPLSKGNQGIFYNNGGRPAGHSHIPANLHNWSYDKDIAVRQFKYTRGVIISVAYEIF